MSADRINDLEERLLLLERRVGLLARTTEPKRYHYYFGMAEWGHTKTSFDSCDACGITGQAWEYLKRSDEMFRCPAARS